MRVVNRFSWHKHHGDFAEKYLRYIYFRKLGLSFRKIRKDKNGIKPEGYVLDENGEKIALVEIKLIKSQKRKSGVHIITIDETIQRAIRSAKKQLRAIDTDLPRIIYLIRDDVFFKEESLRWALFGKWTTVCRGSMTIFNGYSGFYPRTREDNKFRDNLLSAVICYLPTLKGYSLWVYQNKDATSVPTKLLDKKNAEEIWNYNSHSLKRTK